jgi:hypothetical protein
MLPAVIISAHTTGPAPDGKWPMMYLSTEVAADGQEGQRDFGVHAGSRPIDPGTSGAYAATARRASEIILLRCSDVLWNDRSAYRNDGQKARTAQPRQLPRTAMYCSGNVNGPKLDPDFGTVTVVKVGNQIVNIKKPREPERTECSPKNVSRQIILLAMS